MRKLLLFSLGVIMVSFLGGCGDSDSSSASSSDVSSQSATANTSGGEDTLTSSLSGIVMDDYLVGATVCVDRDENYICSSSEPSTTTTTNGAYVLKMAPSDVGTHPLIAVATASTITVDENGTRRTLGNSLILITPKEAQGEGTISPITTMIQANIDSGSSFTEAQQKVMASLGITDGNTSMLYANYMDDNSTLSVSLRNQSRRIGGELLGTSPANYTQTIEATSDKAASGAYSDDGGKFRLITVENHCPYDVKLSSKGSSASQIACTNTDCPTGYFCYKKSDTARYCVPGSVTSGTALPVTDLNESGVTVNKAGCKAGADAYSPGNQFVDEGQCRCRKDSDCSSSQICKLVDTDNYWGVCYWQLGDEDGEYIKSNDSTVIKIDENATNPKPGQSTIQSGGRFDVNIGCDEAGSCASNADNSNPATSIEFTFATGGPDYYDISYINGFNTPATMYPDFNSTTSDFNMTFAGNYSCGAAGADASTLDAVVKAQKAKTETSPMSGFAGLGCTNNFDTVFTDSSNLVGMNFIYSDRNASSQITCEASGKCDPVDGVAQYCGLTFDQVNDNNDTMVCGYRVGYWTYAQFCAVNNDFSSSKIKSSTGVDINCSKPAKEDGKGTNASYALCKNIGNTTDAATSCWNNPAGGYCCGWAEWSQEVNGTTIDWNSGDTAKGNSGNWKTPIEPFVKIVKDACPLAYSYQYDDPYSTFQCKTTDANISNRFGYIVELCKEGNAGLYPPKMSCNTDFSAVNLQLPEGYQATVAKDSSKDGTFSTAVDLNASSDFNVTTTSEYYKITLQNLDPDKNATCSCVYQISQNSCIINELDSNSSGICCNSWTVIDGDSIQMSQFYGAGDTSRCPSSVVPSGWTSQFLATAPADYNISISYTGGAAVVTDGGDSVTIDQGTYSASKNFKVSVKNPGNTVTKTCDIVAPKGAPAQSIYIDSSGTCDSGFGITCTGAQSGRNIVIGGGW